MPLQTLALCFAYETKYLLAVKTMKGLTTLGFSTLCKLGIRSVYFRYKLSCIVLSSADFEFLVSSEALEMEYC